jgi:D-xylose transport system permease protein
VRRYAAENNISTPIEEIFISHGFAIPVLIMIAVGVGMTFLMSRTRFGRYVFAIGGNPEAAELAGIKTKWITVKIFALMGALCGLSAIIASARLNSATNALGTLDELYVIAAAVIGGTSFAGGIGTIYGAILGAVVMQSLQTGMILIGFDTAIQQMVVGGVLVFAVWIDTIYRRRAK